MSALDQRNLDSLSHRSIIPLALLAKTRDIPDPANVQGDVIYLFPKVRFGVVLNNELIATSWTESRELHFL